MRGHVESAKAFRDYNDFDRAIEDHIERMERREHEERAASNVIHLFGYEKAK